MTRTLIRTLTALPTTKEGLWVYTLVPVERKAGPNSEVTCYNVCRKKGFWFPTIRVCGEPDEFPWDTTQRDTRGVLSCPPCAIRFVNHRFNGHDDPEWEDHIRMLQLRAIQQMEARFG
jgi:hypothetical protein